MDFSEMIERNLKLVDAEGYVYDGKFHMFTEKDKEALETAIMCLVAEKEKKMVETNG